MIGSSIAHYRITGKLGEGGMGEVYRAADDRLNREVAIKILPASVEGDADRLARFRREAQLLAALSHGNIAAVYGLEEQDGHVAIVLELVEGETLEERIARGPIPFDDASEIATQIAVAFEVAHEKGIIHRDLKPANVKITPEGVVKVLDFGLAKALAVETASGDGAHPTTSPTVTSAQTRDGVILGTAAYMSPEQARGKPVDRRADIWAFGALFYEMLTGRTAFAGETVSDTLVAILSGEADLDALPSSVPNGARLLLGRCLEKDAKRRLRDIGEARIALEDLAAGVQAPLVEESSAAVPRATAMPRIRSVGLALAAVAAFGAGWLLRTPEPTTDILPDDRSIRRLSYNDHLEFAPSLSPDGNYVVYTTSQNGNLDLEVMPLGGGSVNRLTDHPADDAQASWSPDGRRIAFVSGRERDSGLMVSSGGLGQDSTYVVSEGGDLFLMPALGGAATKLIDRASYPTWSPDSKSIVFQSNRDGNWRLWKIPAEGGEPVQLTKYDDGRFDFHPSWSPDGKWIAFGSLTPTSGRGLFVIPATGGEPIEIYDGVAISPAWAPDSSGVYFSSSRSASNGRHNLWFIPFDPAAGGATHPKRITFGTGSDVGIRISEDGKRHIFSQLNFWQKVWALEVATGAISPITNENGSLEDAPHLHPDGKRLLFQGDRSGESKIWVRDLETGELQILVTPEEASLPRWSPDGEQVAYANSSDDPSIDSSNVVVIQRWGESTREIRTGPGADAATGLQWSPDGTKLVGADNRTNVWVHTIGGESTLLVEGASFGTWSPDGTEIAYQRDAGSDHRELWVIPAAGGEPRMIIGGEIHLSHPQWHPTDADQILVVIDHLELGIVSVSDGTLEVITDYRSSTTLVDYPSWSPDGQTIYFSASQGRGDLYVVENQPEN